MIGLIFPSKQVGFISGSIAPRMVFVPIHTKDIVDRGNCSVVPVCVSPGTEEIGVVANRSSRLRTAFWVGEGLLVSKSFLAFVIHVGMIFFLGNVEVPFEYLFGVFVV